MKVVSHKQNSKLWREWRGKGIGASDAPIIMGDSPWQSAFELWLDKTGLCPKSPPNEFAVAAMRRGTDLEPKARSLFETKINALFPDVAAEHDEFPFLRASFDGYNAELNAICEIKCPGKDSHGKALKGIVPDVYKAQVQQQLMISGAKVCYYVSWDGVSNDLAIIEVLPDKAYQAQLLKSLEDFWTRVQTQVPPNVDKREIAKFAKRVEADQIRLAGSIKALSIALEHS